jgi:hypothetical protein
MCVLFVLQVRKTSQAALLVLLEQELISKGIYRYFHIILA